MLLAEPCVRAFPSTRAKLRWPGQHILQSILVILVLVKTVLNDSGLWEAWVMELSGMRQRFKRNRRALHDQLVNVLKTPGDWNYLLNERGLFSCLALSPSQCKTLVSTYHIHLPGSGRINVSGLSEDNVARTAKAIDEVVRMSGEQEI